MSAQLESAVTGPSAAVKTVAVIGGGTMGNGIAQAFATSGFEVRLVDQRQDLVERALGTIAKNLDRAAKKQSWPADQAAAIVKRVRGGVSFEAAGDCQLAVEAVPEDLPLKRRVFEQLAKVAPEAILATNTSSISITEIATATPRPDRVIGMHFMNPVPVMRLVEVIRGLATSDATYAVVEDLCARLGKTAVAVHDYPGFVSNRVLLPMINEAVYCLMEGVATRESIDTVMKDRKSTRLNSSHIQKSRMPSSA